MAEGEEGLPNSKKCENLNNEGLPDDNGQSSSTPDLGRDQAQANSSGNTMQTSKDSEACSSKSNVSTRKEENPFSFRHFLKRDLSLPGSSCYESTGARPKVYTNTAQEPPSRAEPPDSRRDRAPREPPTQAKDTSRDGSSHRLSDNTTSSSSIELPFSVVDNSESKNNLYTVKSETFYQRPNVASEPLGMPSLPDFVQDHILVEQAYLNTNGPISVDLDNLPDFTFNTNYNAGPSSWSQRNNSGYGGSSRGYNYEQFAGVAGSSSELPGRNVPLDLPAGAEAAGLPLDLAPHLNLDLTESVNPADRRNNSPRNTFPLDLPPNAGAESMRLPDFLPMHPGRTSPEPEHGDEQLQQILFELERTRSELFSERTRRSQVESELLGARLSIEVLESRASKARATEEALRNRLQEVGLDDQASNMAGAAAAAAKVDEDIVNTITSAYVADTTVTDLKREIKRLKEELAFSQEEARLLRNRQSVVSRDLRQASSVAEISLRDLLAGLEQLRSLSATLDPT